MPAQKMTGWESGGRRTVGWGWRVLAFTEQCYAVAWLGGEGVVVVTSRCLCGFVEWLLGDGLCRCNRVYGRPGSLDVRRMEW